MLHGFEKSTAKMPLSAIKVAQERLHHYLIRQKGA